MSKSHLTQRNLLLRRGVFPCDYFDHPDKLNQSNLPSKEQFYSKLTMSQITYNDYAHAKNVWREFNCKIFRHHHDVYLAIDALLLADFFENFRAMSRHTSAQSGSLLYGYRTCLGCNAKVEHLSIYFVC